MARKAIVVKQQKLEEKRIKSLAKWKKSSKPTRHYNRCKVCGRSHSYIREFGICRICFRTYAREGVIMWVRKASW